MTDPDAPTPNGHGSGVASPARVYDFLLGGKDNYHADRVLGRTLAAAFPQVRTVAKANRRFLVRAVRYAAGAGVRQFIDLGTGLPTSPNVHEVATEIHPDAKIVYVDHDPVVSAYNRALLATQPGVIAVEADIRHPTDILTNPDVALLIDFSRPVAVLFVAVLHFISAEDDPAGIVAAFRQVMAPGSYLVISHGVSDSADPAALATAQEAYGDSCAPVTVRPVAEVAAWFSGFKLLRPGLVDVTRWHPGRSPKPSPVRVAAGVGRRDHTPGEQTVS